MNGVVEATLYLVVPWVTTYVIVRRVRRHYIQRGRDRR